MVSVDNADPFEGRRFYFQERGQGPLTAITRGAIGNRQSAIGSRKGVPFLTAISQHSAGIGNRQSAMYDDAHHGKQTDHTGEPASRHAEWRRIQD